MMEDADDLDEFLLDSIQRYNTLLMFNLENTPCHLIQLDATSICIGCNRNRGNNSELLKLQLPKKLLLPPEEEGLCKENDFKVLSGTYTEASVYSMDKLKNENSNVITSEYGIKGLNIYNLSSSTGSSMQQEKLSEVPWINPDFVVMEETKNIICSKSNCEPLILVDISSKKTKEIEHPFNTLDTSESKETGNSIKCQSLSKDIIAILNIYTGKLVLHDLRTPDDFMNLSESSKTNSNEIWTISKHDTNTSPNYFGILSNKQSLCIYDKRTNCQLFRSVGVNSQKNYYNNFKLKFCKKEDKFSVSGLDSNVNVFSMINNTFSQVFTHNGHNPSTLSMKYVTDHIWLPVQDKELIVSICENKTLNCWDFRVKD